MGFKGRLKREETEGWEGPLRKVAPKGIELTPYDYGSQLRTMRLLLLNLHETWQIWLQSIEWYTTSC